LRGQDRYETVSHHADIHIVLFIHFIRIAANLLFGPIFIGHNNNAFGLRPFRPDSGNKGDRGLGFNRQQMKPI
jgi:hypothetical protein